MSLKNFDFIGYIEQNAKRRKELEQPFLFRLYDMQEYKADFILEIVHDVRTKMIVWELGVDDPSPLEKFALHVLKDLTHSLYTPPSKETKKGKKFEESD